MYRDLIGAPVKIECLGKTWWYQCFNSTRGELEAVRLYDEAGDYVAEFETMEELQIFLEKVVSK